MRIHIGCGSVYLEKWLNLDMPGPHTFLAEDRPDLVERWKTTDDQYYAKHKDKTQDALRKGPRDQEYVCDQYANFSNLPVAYWSVDEILARHSFEHLSLTEAHAALDQMDGALKEGGILRLDVPDHEATLRAYRETGDEFYIRHLLGPRRNDYGYHLMSYSRERLRKLVEEHGFVFLKEEPNIHFYPAFCLRFVKPGERCPHEYVELPPLEKDGTFLDIGPGRYPHPLATHYLDYNFANLKPLQDQKKAVIVANINSGLPDIPYKHYSYVWMSHVMEHMDDPATVAATLTRIGKRGTLVVPSVVKESMFNFEEGDHKWLIFPSVDPIVDAIFVRHNGTFIKKIADPEVQQNMCRLFRTGPNRLTPEARYLRRWFYQKEPDLDIVIHWKDRLRFTVIG